jgi:UDP-N-acetyl-D-galactosamine dehydrogenase
MTGAAAQTRVPAIIGLGYVGLPVALALARKYPGTVGYDANPERVHALNEGYDWTGEVCKEVLAGAKLKCTADPRELEGANVYIVCVPTPIHPDRRPDLEPLRSASATVGKVLKKGDIVCYESTVYPGVTEDFCGPILAKTSGLRQGADFRLGYSPERINPGDTEHTFETIKKIVAGEDAETLDVLADIYGSVVTAGIHRAQSIKVGELAKVLENTQRDLNIALMNELAIISDLLCLRTKDVLDAARTKWNFLPFAPGLVGGHCIGVDPFYLTSKAQELGYHPEVILAGRRINDSMGGHIGRRIIQFLAAGDRPVNEAKVGIVGITFKENVRDTRNSKVPDVVAELRKFGIAPLVTDIHADAHSVQHEYGIRLTSMDRLFDLDALVLCVPHEEYLKSVPEILSRARDGAVFVDVKSAVSPADVPPRLRYWSL